MRRDAPTCRHGAQSEGSVKIASVLDRPMHQWQQLFAAVLQDHPVVGVRAVIEWHLGRSATRSESEAARRAVRAMERAGRVTLQQVSVPRQPDQLGGRLLVAGRGDLSLLDWPNQTVLRAAARSHPPDLHETRAALQRMLAALNEATMRLDRLPLAAAEPELAREVADAMGKPLARLGR